MKTFKLLVHQQNFSPEDVIINSKDSPQINVNDIIEIYHIDDSFSRLLLMVKCLTTELNVKEAVSIHHTIANLFQFKNFKNVCMNVVNKEDVELDLLELTFREQYISRSDMWRLKQKLVNNCAHIQKKIQFAGIRAQVTELWSKGERVASGFISERTKVVLRSSTAMLYIFIQMSSEMWEFDVNGDLYFEKAIDGFLSELFSQWKGKRKWKGIETNHDVTIVLFSRQFYDTKLINDFPVDIRSYICTDYRGQCYRDFYRIVVQNQRHEDWKPVLVSLKQIFNNYAMSVTTPEDEGFTPDSGGGSPDSDGFSLPLSQNSTAGDGNFLEAINMSLNVFDKHFIDRNFDRTGQKAIIITPGSGVFGADPDLCYLTKRRIIDNGIACDLICMAEKPLHSVPLFKFDHHRRARTCPNCTIIGGCVEYYIPYWLNTSYYKSKENQSKLKFIPLILPSVRPTSGIGGVCSRTETPPDIDWDEDEDETDDESYYDDNSGIFKPVLRPSTWGGGSRCSFTVRSRDSKSSMTRVSGGHRSSQSYDDDSHTVTASVETLQGSIKPQEYESETETAAVPATGIYGSNHGHMNPFAPSKMPVKITSNRRRWIHSVPSASAETPVLSPAPQLLHPHQTDLMSRYSSCHSLVSNDSATRTVKKLPPSKFPTHSTPPSNDFQIDWKSLSFPLVFPITTDFTPDPQTLNNHYLFNQYNICTPLESDVYKPVSIDGIFRELVSQRLMQGFQIIVGAEELAQKFPHHKHPCSNTVVNSPSLSKPVRDTLTTSRSVTDTRNSYCLSMGRIYHLVQLENDTSVNVTIFKPNRPKSSSQNDLAVKYDYYLWPSQHSRYEFVSVTFQHEKLENYNWNYLDFYVSGYNPDLLDSLKYWRCRYLVLPIVTQGTRRINEQAWPRCDIYDDFSPKFQSALRDGFMKFVENLNRIRRFQPTPRSKPTSSIHDIEIRSSSPNRPSLPRRGSMPDSQKKLEAAAAVSAVKADQTCLTLDSSHVEIAQAMLDSSLFYLPEAWNFPSHTFISTDAVKWLTDHITGVTQAAVFDRLEAMVTRGIIYCLCKEYRNRFQYGMIFYAINKSVSPSPTQKLTSGGESSVATTTETVFETPGRYIGPTDCFLIVVDPESMTSHMGSSQPVTPMWRSVDVNPDLNNSSDYSESFTVQYLDTYRPNNAFVLEVQWMCATGCILYEHLMVWVRKAPACGFNMVPAPLYPFSLPRLPNSDPHRIPLFIPLSPPSSEDVDDFVDYVNQATNFLINFQSLILRKFGFIRDPGKSNSGMMSGLPELKGANLQFVHVTGVAFVHIPVYPFWVNSRDRTGTVMKAVPPPNIDDIPLNSRQPGFYWSQNHLLSKKRTQNTDEHFIDKLLNDFTRFCSRGDERLFQMWTEFSEENSVQTVTGI